MYDVIVVGAGPAGSTAARTCALNGCKTLLIEEHKEIGIPLACGEAVSRKWFTKFFTADDRWISSKINGAIFLSPSGKSFQVSYPDVGYILERKIFDRDLALIAVEAGADLKVGTRAVGLTENGIKIKYEDSIDEVQAKVIIGADGPVSRIGKWTGIDVEIRKEDFWIGQEYLLASDEIKEGYVEFAVGNSIAPGGYAWVFPKAKNMANVGLGIWTGFKNASPKVLLNRFIKKRFTKFNILGEYSGIVPSKNSNTLVKGNVCIVGDAARMVDPLSGGGIENAILSGHLAGKRTAETIKTGDIKRLRLYEKDWEKQKAKEFRFNMKIRNIFLKLKDTDIETIFDFGKRNFDGKVIDEINIFEIIKGILKFSPRLLRLGKVLIQ